MNSPSRFSAGTSAPSNSSLWMQVSKELAATAASVVCYHPVQTVVLHRFASSGPIPWTFREVYKGFGPALLASHQLFLMGTTYQLIKKHFGPAQTKEQECALAALSGMLSSVTTTPCVVATLNKQRHLQTPFYRGFVPMTVRQAGLGVGILAMPGWCLQLMQGWAPKMSKRYKRASEVGCSLLSGLTVSVATQPCEGARVLMQFFNMEPLALRESEAISTMEIY